MKIFVIHKAEDILKAQKEFKKIEVKINVKINFIFLKESLGNEWKDRASTRISESELCVVFNPEKAKKSQNVLWEIDKAEGLKKRIIEFHEGAENNDFINVVKAIYYFDQEFDSHFFKMEDNAATLELYKIMVASSESLMARRQSVNSFFWTIIAAIFACVGYLWVQKIHDQFTIAVFLIPLLIGFFVANSWRNLLINYGKLNRGKFRVINKIEEKFPVSIFSAEWIALGKGARPDVYSSFTETEANVPKLIFWIFLLPFAFIIAWLAISNFKSIIDFFVDFYYLFFKKSFFGENILRSFFKNFNCELGKMMTRVCLGS